MECLPLSMLLKYLRGQGSSSEHIVIYAHLFLSRGCPVCQENLQLLETIINVAALDKSFEFSEETLATIVAEFKEQKATALQPIRQYLAELVYDSGLLPQSSPVRPPSKRIVRRQELYHAEGYDIDLLFIFCRDIDDEQLAGQVVPENGDAPEVIPFKVELLEHGVVVSATNTDKHGVFEFFQLMSKAYDLKVCVPEGEINLERVQTARAL